MRILFGGDSISRSASDYPTVEALRANADIASLLGFNWADVEVRVNGTVQTSGTLRNADQIDIVTRANTKGC